MCETVTSDANSDAALRSDLLHSTIHPASHSIHILRAHAVADVRGDPLHFNVQLASHSACDYSITMRGDFPSSHFTV